MTDASAGTTGFFRAPHPLAVELAAQLDRQRSAVLVLGTGSDRNLPVLRSHSAHVAVIDENGDGLASLASASIDAILSTHGLLHGRHREIATRIGELRRVARKPGILYATFGSLRDARCGRGSEIEPNVFVVYGGDEPGIPHAFFDRAGVAALLDGFVIDDAREIHVDDIAGKSAHQQRPLRGAVHWFVKARRS